MKQTIDRRFIAALRAGKIHADITEPFTVWDDRETGFVARVRPRMKNGRRVGAEKRVSYAVKYGAKARGKSRWVHIGGDGKPYQDPQEPGKPKKLDAVLARAEAIRLLGERNAGKDPALGRKVARVCPFLSDYVKKVYVPWSRDNKGAATVEKDSSQQRRLVADLGHCRLTEITTDMIDTWHKGRTHGANGEPGTPSAADNGVKMLSAILNHARDVKKILPKTFLNPCEDIKLNGDNHNERYLSVDEMRRLAANINAAGKEAGVFLTCVLLTGTRPGEILKLRRSDVKREDGVALITRKCKGKRLMPVQIPEEPMAALDSLTSTGDLYFPSVKDPKKPKDLSTFQYAWQAVREAAGLPDVQIRHFRHTFATFANKAGVPFRTLGELLGHSPKSPQTTMRYTHVTPEGAQESAAATAKSINGVLRFKLRAKPTPKPKAAPAPAAPSGPLSASALRRQAAARRRIS